MCAILNAPNPKILDIGDEENEGSPVTKTIIAWRDRKREYGGVIAGGMQNPEISGVIIRKLRQKKCFKKKKKKA